MIPGSSATGWQVLVASIGTPESIIQKASKDLRSVVTDPDLQKRIAARGSYTRAMSPAEIVGFVAGEQRKWKPIMELIAQKTQ
jgi:tripartite-type tricarboxylate transporter receptor subunit TctC